MEEKKEMVAISKQVVESMLTELIEKNKNVFNTFFELQKALQTAVKMETKLEEPIVAEDANETEPAPE